MHFASPPVRQPAWGSSFLPWMKSGGTYASSHRRQLPSPSRKLLCQQRLPCGSPLSLDGNQQVAGAMRRGPDTLWACHWGTELLCSLLSEALHSSRRQGMPRFSSFYYYFCVLESWLWNQYILHNLQLRWKVKMFYVVGWITSYPTTHHYVSYNPL